MVSHVVVGASRGIGYQLLKHFSQDPADTVVGLARDATKVQEKARKDGLQNVIILGADMTDYDTLLKAAEETRKVTDGSVDYLWNNGGHMGYVTIGKFFSDFEPEQYGELLKDLRQNFETNVIGVINAINAFLPLVKKSSIKKVITLTTGLSDNNLTRDYGIWEHAPYAVGKAAVNTVVAKYDARYRSEGILFLGVSPGLVQTGGAFPEDSEMPAKFFKYAPEMQMIEPPESVEAMWKVVDSAKADEDGGQAYSHLGKGKKWL